MLVSGITQPRTSPTGKSRLFASVRGGAVSAVAAASSPLAIQPTRRTTQQQRGAEKSFEVVKEGGREGSQGSPPPTRPRPSSQPAKANKVVRLPPVDPHILDFLQRSGVWPGLGHDALLRLLQEESLRHRLLDQRYKANQDEAKWSLKSVKAMYDWLGEATKSSGWPSAVRGVPTVRFLIEKAPALLLHNPCILRARWFVLHNGPLLGLSQAQAVRVICALPSLLWMPSEQLKQRIQLLREQGVEDIATCVSRSAATGCAVLSMDAISLSSKLRLLAAHGLAAGNMLERYPKLLEMSDHTLELKLAFWLRELRLPPSALQSSPRLLNLGVVKRLRPRLELLRGLDAPLVREKGAPPGLLTLLRATAPRFESHLTWLRGLDNDAAAGDT